MSLGTIPTNLTVSFTPQVETNQITSPSLFTVIVTNSSGPVVGVRVDFQISGSNTLYGFAFTDENGHAMFAYSALKLGTDVLHASVGNGSAVGTNFWVTTSFQLQGIAADDGLPGGVTNVTWSQLSGPATVSFSNSHVTNPIVQVPKAGAYAFRLTANDSVLTNHDDTTVTVQYNGASLTTNSTITLSAVAFPRVGEETIAQVDFYTNGVFFATSPSSASPYTFNWVSPPAGTYVLTAVDTLQFDDTTVSTPITFTVH